MIGNFQWANRFGTGPARALCGSHRPPQVAAGDGEPLPQTQGEAQSARAASNWRPIAPSVPGCSCSCSSCSICCCCLCRPCIISKIFFGLVIFPGGSSHRTAWLMANLSRVDSWVDEGDGQGRRAAVWYPVPVFVQRATVF